MKQAVAGGETDRTARDEAGSVTLIAVVSMLVMAIMAVSLMLLGRIEARIGVNHTQEVRAVQAAEAGARHMFRLFASNAPTWSTYDLLSQTLPETYVDAGDTARYSVTVVDKYNDGCVPAVNRTDCVVMIRSEGRSFLLGGAVAAQATVGLLVSGGGPLRVTDGVRVANFLKLNGNPHIKGQCGSVHVPVSPGVTGDLNIDLGDPVVEKGASTSGTAMAGDYYFMPPPPSGSQVTPATGVPARRVPAIDYRQFGKYADYLLLDNGFAYRLPSGATPGQGGVVDPGTLPVCLDLACANGRPDPPGWIKDDSDDVTPGDQSTTVSGQCSFGWRMNSQVSSSGPAVWTLCGPLEDGYGTPGTFFVVGKAVISQDIGTPVAPYKVTLITYGSVEISGSPVLAWDDLVWPAPASLNALPPDHKTVVVTGRDFKLNGNPGNNIVGAFLAEEQLDISGNPTITGAFMAENNSHDLSSWPTADGTVTESQLSGNAIITYDCGLDLPDFVTAPVTAHAWVAL